MAKPAAYIARIEDGIAVVTLDRPPVNAIGAAIESAVAKVINDIEDGTVTGVRGIVLHGAGRCFCAGADIGELGGGAKVEKIKLKREKRDFIGMEGMSVPVVAAIHGLALGGGLEIALSCHYRVIDSKAMIGLPEVNLGLLPGGQGTQRLPRLIGAENAIKFMTVGNHVPAKLALEWGVVDQVAEPGTVLETAIAFCKTKVGAPLTRISDMAPPAPVDFNAWTKKLMKKRPGEPAGPAIVKCVEAACTGPDFDAGMKVEQNEFVRLLASPESKALRYMFFAERAGTKVKGLKAKPVAIKSVGIVGAGLMGGGIAMCCANVGIDVVLLDMNEKGLNRGLKLIENNYARSVKSGSRSAAWAEKARGHIKGTTQYSDLAQADLIVEAVFEDMDIKKKIFKQLDSVCKPGAFLCSNTSFLDIDEIASVVSHPELVMGTHFFSPANVMKLLENVKGAKTSDVTIASMMEWGKRIGKWAILVGNCDGFVGNRMMKFYMDQARLMALEGASPTAIDKAARAFGMRMGPMAMSDLVGNDLGIQAVKKSGQYKPDTNIQHALVEAGRLGLKSGSGYFDYADRKPVHSEAMASILSAVAANNGIKQKDISDAEIVERLFYPLINEGFKIMSEGIANKPADVDVCYVHGYGFPRYRGGPMLYADSVGLPRVAAGLEKMGAEPCWLLKQCVDNKMTLAKYWKKNGDDILAAANARAKL